MANQPHVGGLVGGPWTRSLDFHAPIKTFLNLRVLIIEGIKIGFREERV